MCKRLIILFAGILALPLFLVKAFAADAGLAQLVYEVASEKDLRAVLTKKFPNHPIEKFKSGNTQVICVMPRLRGGGNGVRSILLYYGSDTMGGWGLVLNCSTFATDIKAKIENEFLVFSNAQSSNVIIKVALTPEFLGRLE